MFDEGLAGCVGRRSVIAVGSGYYGYGRTRHKCLQCPRIMQIGDKIARGATPSGTSLGFTHGLIAVTPAKRSGGIGKHKDQECVPGTSLLALALDGGDRKVTFDMPRHGPTQIQGDYLATKGLHVDVEHEVVTKGYTVSITFRV